MTAPKTSELKAVPGQRTIQRMPETKPRQDQAAARRQQILEAARALFAEKGFHATSIRDVHRQLAVSDGLLYHYFPSKFDLLNAVIEDGFAGMFQGRLADDVPARATVPEVLRQTGHRLWERWAKNEDLMRILFRDYHVFTDLGDYSLPAAFMRSAQGLSDLLRERQRSGELRADLDPFVATREFIFSMLGYYLFQVVLGGEHVVAAPLDEHLEQVIDMLWRGWRA